MTAMTQADPFGPGQPFEIVEQDIRGVRTRTWRNAPSSLRAILDQSRTHGDATFLVYEDERLTFEDHFRAVTAAASWLAREAGVAKGDRVAVAMRNYPEWSIAFWAAAAIGAIVVPLNAWWTGDELLYGLDDSGTKVLLADAERAERLGGRRPDALEQIVVARTEGATDGVGWEDVIGGTGAELPGVEIDPDDDATIFYTSGTTGFPKGAVGTHRNICTNLMNLAVGRAARAQAGPPTTQAASLLSVPFFHATGCHSTLVPAAMFGSKLVMMYRFDPERALELIERERITSFGGVPAMVWKILESPDFDKRDLSSVQSIGYGGAPAPPELVRKIEKLVPKASPGNGYGLTETSSLAIGNGGADYLRKPDSVGRPVPVCEVKVVGEDGNEVATDELGELWIKGPNVVRGYWNKPEATAETFTDGWLRTGDVGCIDEEGFVYIRDRAKDMIIRGGENVYCAEVEAAIFEHPAVSDAAVIGIPDRVLGEEVGAVVQLKPGESMTSDDLREHCAQRIAAFKVPVRIWFTDDALPRNPAGKVLKRQLRDELAGEGAV